MTDIPGSKPYCALITGANRGLGLALTTRLLQDHHTRVTLGIREFKECPDIARIREQYPDRASIIHLDYANPESLAEAAHLIIEERLDLLINCGAANYWTGLSHQASKGPLELLSYQALGRLFEINVAGPVCLVQSLLPLLTAGKGTVVNVSTTRASAGMATTPSSFGYSVTKSALNMATRKLASELKSSGIEVVAMDPGWVRTRMGGNDAPTTPGQAADTMLKTLFSMRGQLNGRFIDSHGADIPW